MEVDKGVFGLWCRFFLSHTFVDGRKYGVCSLLEDRP